MQRMEAILEPLIQSPKLDHYIRQLSALRDGEQAVRERFRAEVAEGEKIEFINGQIVPSMPVLNQHLKVSELLSTLLSTFVRVHNLGRIAVEKCRIALTRNDYEPDICFWKREIAETFTPRQLNFPPPNFVVEILSDSTERNNRNDRTIKFEDYAAHGIEEYWIIDPDAETLEQYVLQGMNGETVYHLHIKSTNGTVQSRAIEGFTMPVRALFDDDENLAAMRTLLA
jgi:Uma2 family endonuclease